ncbi:YitT family protein [Sporolactobacillus sp. THM19-2]|uniref:YczE/YyaS/YitT family protein n=1 Tax=Sporolactobacillus sp. THM19-2 TaxID=2511171 RepID=UPI00101EC117|nr:membrane protein [Sporolactobacillus sp. THM19-2]RYL93295.1 membrane protein [Sporolactobacillus sp. THM19-2]
MSESLENKHHWLEIFLKSIFSFIGVAILALGATLCKVGNIGLDPFTAVNIGISHKLNMSLGLYQLIANAFIMIFVILLDRKKIGIGTVINMVGAGFMIDWFSGLYSSIFHFEPSMLTSVVNGILGLLLFTLGTSLYMSTNLGVAPYDALAPIASTRLHIKYRFCRVAQDIGFMVAALFFGGPIGLATIIISFFAGPLITFWDKSLSDRLISGLVEFSKQPSGKSIGHGVTGAGRFTYGIVKKSYNQTLEIQEKLSQYTDLQLQLKQEQARQDLEDARKLVINSRKMYGMLKREEERRAKDDNSDGD